MPEKKELPEKATSAVYNLYADDKESIEKAVATARASYEIARHLAGFCYTIANVGILKDVVPVGMIGIYDRSAKFAQAILNDEELRQYSFTISGGFSTNINHIEQRTCTDVKEFVRSFKKKHQKAPEFMILYGEHIDSKISIAIGFGLIKENPDIDSKQYASIDIPVSYQDGASWE